MRTFAAILLGKAIAYFTRLFRFGGGSAAPGLYALKIDPGIILNLSSKIPTNVVITGTNGKTTTAKMLTHFAMASGLKVIRNHTGSNLERGIASTLIQDLRLHSKGVKLNFNLGIWELDEAAFNTVAPKLNPDVIIFLNVSRDQLDRYGEIDKIVNNWCQTLSKISSKTTLIINGDDKALDKLAPSFSGKKLKFHLPKNIKLNGLDGSKFQIANCFSNCLWQNKFQINLPVPGIYNVYNFLAAFSVGCNLGLDPKNMIASLKNFFPAFGRVEKLPFGYIFLIKNPAGANQVFQTIAPNIKSGDRLFLALNDNIADGTDVSWIWDANFELLPTTNYQLPTTCSGTRAHDLALRLKYAGFDPKQIAIEPDLQIALKQARTGLKGQLFILPTYTAMLELQSILAKSGLKKLYWKEQ